MKNILCPVDFTADSMTAAKYAFEIAARAKAKLVLLHTYHMPSREAGVNYDAETSAKVKHEGERKLQELNDQLIQSNPLAEVSTAIVVKYGFAADEIPVQVQAHHADLVVMNTGGASGLVRQVVGTVSVSVMEDSPCPVLIIPNGWEFKPFSKIVYATDLEGNQEGLLTSVANFAKAFSAHLTMVHILGKDHSTSDKEAKQFSLNKLLESHEYKDHSFQFYAYEDVISGIYKFSKEESADLIVMATRPRSFWKKLFSMSTTEKVAYHPPIPLLTYHK